MGQTLKALFFFFLYLNVVLQFDLRYEAVSLKSAKYPDDSYSVTHDFTGTVWDLQYILTFNITALFFIL